ncbi:MAG: tyrosine-type recombinase/integrase, partial [Aeromicrobium sp.]
SGVTRARRRRPSATKRIATGAIEAIKEAGVDRSRSEQTERQANALRPRIQQAVRRLKVKIGVSGRLSPHSLRHTFARGYLVNGGDVFSLQRILGRTTLDMVKRYVALAELEIVRRLHAVASPADRLLIGPRVSVILPRVVFRRLSEIGDRTRLTVEQLVGISAERLAMSPQLVPGLG